MEDRPVTTSTADDHAHARPDAELPAGPPVPTLEELARAARGQAGAVRLHLRETASGAAADLVERVPFVGDAADVIDLEPPIRGTLESVAEGAGGLGELVVRAPGVLRDRGEAAGFLMVRVSETDFAWGCRCHLEHVADVRGVADELRYTFACDPAEAWVPSRRAWRYRLPASRGHVANVMPLAESAPPQPGAPKDAGARRPRPVPGLAVQSHLLDVGEGGIGCEMGPSAGPQLELFDRFLVEVPAPANASRGFAAVVRVRDVREGEGGRLVAHFEFEHARVPDSLQHAYVLTDVTRFVVALSNAGAAATDRSRAA